MSHNKISFTQQQARNTATYLTLFVFIRQVVELQKIPTPTKNSRTVHFDRLNPSLSQYQNRKEHHFK